MPVDPEEKDPSYTVVKTVTSEGSAEGGKYKAGETVEYKIVVTNTGNVTLSDIVVTDTMSNGASVTWADGTETNEAGNPVVASLAPNATATLTATYVVTQADVDAQATIENVATATAKDPGDDPVDPDEPTPVPVDPEDKNPGISVTKTVTSTPANGSTYGVGETITYRIAITNSGNITLTNIQVIDTMNGIAGAQPTPSASSIASLAPGVTASVTVSYTVVAGDQGNTVSNTAIGAATDPTDPGAAYTDTDTTPGEPITPAPTPGPTPGPGPTPPTPTPDPTPTPEPTPEPTPAEVVPDTPTPAAPTPTETIPEPANPLAPELGSWSLFDLICTILTALASVILLALGLGKTKKDAEEDEQVEQAAQTRSAYATADEDEDPEQIEIKRRRMRRMLSLIPGIGEIVLFILTQDLTLPMAIFDRWSLVFFIATVVQAVICIVSRKKEEDPEDEDEDQQPQGTAPVAA